MKKLLIATGIATLIMSAAAMAIDTPVYTNSTETQGKSISWQTPELTASIMRDDSANRCWKKIATFSTEAQALAYIKNRLSIT